MSESIVVFINQLAHTLPANASLQDAIQASGVKPPFAAAVNLQFVPRGSYTQHFLSANDQIELISPITGG